MAAAGLAPQHLLCDEPALPGLIWAMRFDSGGLARHLDPHVGLPPALDPASGGFDWLHFNLVDARVAGLAETGRLGPARLVASAFENDRHQRIAFEEGHCGATVATPAHGVDVTTPAVAEGRLHVVIGPSLIVSGRHMPLAGPDRAREACEAGEAFHAPIELLEAMISPLVEAMMTTGTRLSDSLDAIEDRVLESRGQADRRRLGAIRRDSVKLHRHLLGLRAVFHRFEQDGGARGTRGSDVATAARLAQRLDSLDRDMVLIGERARLLQEEIAAQLAEQSNRQLYTLSIMTALFLPPTLVTGLFSINPLGLPLPEHASVSVLAVLAALVAAFGAYLLIRRLGIRAPHE